MADQKVYIISIIGSAPQHLRQWHTRAVAAVADLAPTLSEAELRLLLELSKRGIEAPDFSFRASSRDLAKAARCSRPHMLAALDSLSGRGLILCRRGTRTRPSSFRLQFLEVLTLSGSPGEPPLVPHGNHPGSPAVPPWFPTGTTPGSPGEPPPLENTLFDLTPAPPSISIEDPITILFDRLQKARPENFDPTRLEEATNWVHGYQAKFGRDPHPHRPDRRIMAQLLTVAPWPSLQEMLYNLMAERKQPGHSYAWYLTVALQRLHGLSPQAQQQTRAKLKILRHSTQPDSPAQPPTETFDGRQLVEDLAKAKAMSR